jgi:hypothetical protein
MTAIVGILCQDGVVVGADSSVSLGPSAQYRTIEQPIEKIAIIGGSVIVAGTGAVGLGQRFQAIVAQKWSKGEFQEPLTITKDLAKAFREDAAYTYAQPNYAAFVAFPCKKVPCLCEFLGTDFQPEQKDKRLWYCSAGSAVPITDPFLGFIRSVFWQDGMPTLSEGIFAATWTLQHAIEVNPGGVNGPARMAVLEQNKSSWSSRILPESELDQHQQAIQGAKEYLRDFRKQLRAEGATDEVPKV